MEQHPLTTKLLGVTTNLFGVTTKHARNLRASTLTQALYIFYNLKGRIGPTKD